MRAAFALLMNWDLFENQKFYLLRQTTAAVLTGVGGTLLVTIFLATLLPVFKVIHFIPWLIGFNSAMTGYCLVDKTRDALAHRQLVALAAGLANALVTTAALIALCIYTLEANLFGPREIIFFTVIGTACSELGAWLAARYFKL
jgi:hypothetical protein